MNTPKRPTARNQQFHKTFMTIAHTFSKLSRAKRSQVGCVIVKDHKIISTGYNGTPSKTDNCCETTSGDTKPTVLHAELNAVLNATTHDLTDADVYITMSPCQHCAAILAQKNIASVYYATAYRDTSGLELLNNKGIHVEQVTV